MLRRGVLAVALAVAVALVVPVAAREAPAGVRPHTLRLPALHAKPDPVSGGRIVDARGRQVLLRGVNVNALAEYWPGTSFPTRKPARSSPLRQTRSATSTAWIRSDPAVLR